MSTFVGEEAFEACSVGEAAEVVQDTVCDDELILIKGSVSSHLLVNLFYLFLESLNNVLLLFQTEGKDSQLHHSSWPQ